MEPLPTRADPRLVNYVELGGGVPSFFFVALGLLVLVDLAYVASLIGGLVS